MLALPLALLLAAGPGETPAADAARTWILADGSTLAYHLVHPFHSVDGVTRAVEGKARLDPDGLLEVAIRARVASFDSGNSNRDAHMMEVTDAARLPFVTLRGTAEGIRIEGYPTDVEVPLAATLDFHGVTREASVKVRVRLPSPERAEVTAEFPVSLTAHGVKRPSLLFVKVQDRITISARLAFTSATP